jgi:hypothetical protein
MLGGMSGLSGLENLIAMSGDAELLKTLKK